MNWIAIVWSGVVATTLTSAFFWACRSFDWTSFNPSVQLGCLVTRDPRRPITETIGFLIAFAVGSTLGPALFRAVIGFWGGPAWIGGLILGGVLGLGLAAALPLFGTISACIRNGMMPAPGLFGIDWGRPTPGIIFVGHMMYGAVVAAILAAF
jgi:hypothetical protein